jgi:hypothetical protein
MDRRTPHLEPRTRNPEPGTQNPEPGTQNPQPGTRNQEPGAIFGIVSTQNGTIPLGGVVVTLLNESGEVSTTTSAGDGTFRFEQVASGKYGLVATVEGFDPLQQSAMVAAGQSTAATLDLKIASVTERVEVVAPTTVLPSTGTLTSTERLTSRELEQMAGGGGLQAALRMLVSVIQVPGGLSIKGGRPSQAAVQLGPGAFVDPATGLSQVSLPDDAIDSVTVLPNPYAVEFGRFSSGLVLIRTRRAADQWKTRLNNLDPAFRTKRGQPLSIIGLSAFSPRFESGGPLVKDRLFIQQALQYRYRSSDVPSRPQSEVRTSHRLSSFTRVDANLSPRHALVVAAGLFPARSTFTTLGTFTPPNATVDTRGGVNTASVTERSLWSDKLFSETTGEVHGYDTRVIPQGRAAMELLPDTTLGNFFNRQRRATKTYQFIETVSGTSQGRGMLHLFKVGFDLLHSRYAGSSASRPVLIRRANGTLVRRLDFGPVLTPQAINSTDIALFAQDRVQPNNRWYLELGARVDHDGVVGRWNITPRVGSAVLLNAAGTAVLRSGYGLFFERTPSVAGVFSEYEYPIDTRYAPDGLTPISSQPYQRVMAPDLRTSRSLTWDAAYDQRFNANWALRASVIDRRGSHELLVEPVTTAAASALQLNSDGRSTYREAEIGMHFTGDHGIDLNVSYVRSQARADLNAFTTFFDSVLWPVVGRNSFAPARTDTPHRLLARGRALPTPRWLFVGVLDWRSGLPYSVVNEALDFVGRRNDRRFPAYVRVDLGVEHRFKILKYRPWIGVRADNALNSFLPSDVQANTASPAFGSFYNSEYRQFRIQVRFER